MKRIHIETRGNKTAKVYRDSEWNEYRVRLYIDGVLHAPADYHTSEKADAIGTAAAMVRPDPIRPRPLSTAFNVAVLHITDKILPCGFDVSADAPQCYDSLVAHYAETGRVLVWDGASDKTIFADSDVNYAFRAWHDSKHITAGLPFNKAGEFKAMAMQQKDVRAIYDGAAADSFCDLVAAEIAGQFLYNERFGGFPIDQLGFARAYIGNRHNPGVTPCPMAAPARFGISREA